MSIAQTATLERVPCQVFEGEFCLGCNVQHGVDDITVHDAILAEAAKRPVELDYDEPDLIDVLTEVIKRLSGE